MEQAADSAKGLTKLREAALAQESGALLGRIGQDLDELVNAAPVVFDPMMSADSMRENTMSSKYSDLRDPDAGKFICFSDRSVAMRSFIANDEVVRSEWLRNRRASSQLRARLNDTIERNEDEEAEEAAWQEQRSRAWESHREVHARMLQKTLGGGPTAELDSSGSSEYLDAEMRRREYRASLVVAASRAIRLARRSTRSMLSAAHVRNAVTSTETSLGMDPTEAAAMHFGDGQEHFSMMSCEEEANANATADVPGADEAAAEGGVVADGKGEEESSGAFGILGNLMPPSPNKIAMGIAMEMSDLSAAFGGADAPIPSSNILLHSRMALHEVLRVVYIDLPAVGPQKVVEAIDRMSALALSEAARGAYHERETARDILHTHGFGDAKSAYGNRLDVAAARTQTDRQCVFRHPTLIGALISTTDRTGASMQREVGRALCELMQTMCAGFSQAAEFRKGRVVDNGGLAMTLIQLNLSLRRIRDVFVDETPPDPRVRTKRVSTAPVITSPIDAAAADAVDVAATSREGMGLQQKPPLGIKLDTEIGVLAAASALADSPKPALRHSSAYDYRGAGAYDIKKMERETQALEFLQGKREQGKREQSKREQELESHIAAAAIASKLADVKLSSAADDDISSEYSYSYSATGRLRRKVRRKKVRSTGASSTATADVEDVPTGADAGVVAVTSKLAAEGVAITDAVYSEAARIFAEQDGHVGKTLNRMKMYLEKNLDANAERMKGSLEKNLDADHIGQRARTLSQVVRTEEVVQGLLHPAASAPATARASRHSKESMSSVSAADTDESSMIRSSSIQSENKELKAEDEVNRRMSGTVAGLKFARERALEEEEEAVDKKTAEELRREERERIAAKQKEAAQQAAADKQAADKQAARKKGIFDRLPGGGLIMEGTRSITTSSMVSQSSNAPSLRTPTRSTRGSRNARESPAAAFKTDPNDDDDETSADVTPQPSGFWSGFYAKAKAALGMVDEVDDRMHQHVDVVCAACGALTAVCSGFDEAAHQRKALAIDLMSLETILELTERMRRKHLAPSAMPRVMQLALSLWSDVGLFENPSDPETRHVLAHGEGSGTNLPGRRMRAIARLSLGARQFDETCKLMRLCAIDSELLAADVLEVLHVLIPTVLNVSSTRVACVARALIMKQIKDSLLEQYPLSKTVLRAADRVDAGMLSLQLKGTLKLICNLRNK